MSDTNITLDFGIGKLRNRWLEVFLWDIDAFHYVATGAKWVTLTVLATVPTILVCYSLANLREKMSVERAAHTVESSY